MEYQKVFRSICHFSEILAFRMSRMQWRFSNGIFPARFLVVTSNAYGLCLVKMKSENDCLLVGDMFSIYECQSGGCVLLLLPFRHEFHFIAHHKKTKNYSHSSFSVGTNTHVRRNRARARENINRILEMKQKTE